MTATEMIDHLNSRLDALKIENDRLKARPHTTHHDDCGCKSARYEATIAELLEALDTLSLVVGLTPICGNKAALQDAMNIARAAIAKARGEA